MSPANRSANTPEQRTWTRVLRRALVFSAVMLAACGATMRLAIRGAEVAVPDLQGLTLEQARQRADRTHVLLDVENRYYSSAVAPGRILAQLPRPGLLVRRDFRVRVTESLGRQTEEIPDVLGQSERASTLAIRRMGLELGTVAHTPWALQPSGTVIAQNPPAMAPDADRPRVDLLISDPESAGSLSFRMPQLVGQPISTAEHAIEAAGLKLDRTAALSPGNQGASPRGTGLETSSQFDSSPVTNQLSSIDQHYPPGTVIWQNPPAGARVSAHDAIRLAVSQ